MKKGVVCVLFMILIFGNSIVLAGELGLSSKMEGKCNYDGNWEMETDWSGELYLTWLGWKIAVGQEKLLWGQGETGKLTLSPTSPAIPLIYYEGRLNFLNLHYTHLISPLAQVENRWLFGHRLELSLTPQIHFGATELMMCSDRVYPLYYVPVPLVPLYLIQYISYNLAPAEKYDFNSNALMGFDFHYQGKWRQELYGEIIVDDFPAAVHNINPRKFGGLFGVKWEIIPNKANIWGEYVRVNNFVYTHRNPSSRYMYHDRPFGHKMGMDGDLAAVGMEYNFGTKKFKLEFDNIRKGEGDYYDDWSINYGHQYEFLTGVVEIYKQLSLEYEWEISPGVLVTFRGVGGKIENANHLRGVSEKYYQLAAGIKYNLVIKMP